MSGRDLPLREASRVLFLDSKGIHQTVLTFSLGIDFISSFMGLRCYDLCFAAALLLEVWWHFLRLGFHFPRELEGRGEGRGEIGENKVGFWSTKRKNKKRFVDYSFLVVFFRVLIKNFAKLMTKGIGKWGKRTWIPDGLAPWSWFPNRNSQVQAASIPLII